MVRVACVLGSSPANNINEGFRLGQLGLAMYDIFRIKVWLPRLTVTYYYGIHAFKHALSTTFEPLQRAQRVGIET